MKIENYLFSYLYIVSTPIGNLGDISNRAINTINTVNAFICENYSSAKKLFKLLNINSNKPFFVFADINAKKDLNKAIEFIQNNKNVALISEAGTPLINDPGFEIVREIRQNHNEKIKIAVIPGANAITAHLAISGLPTDKFMFLGFLPKTSGKRLNALKLLQQTNNITKTTFILFESKYKIITLLNELNLLYPNCIVSIGNELTKMHEKVYFGRPENVLRQIKNPKGEFVVHVQI